MVHPVAITKSCAVSMRHPLPQGLSLLGCMRAILNVLLPLDRFQTNCVDDWSKTRGRLFHFCITDNWDPESDNKVWNAKAKKSIGFTRENDEVGENSHALSLPDLFSANLAFALEIYQPQSEVRAHTVF